MAWLETLLTSVNCLGFLLLFGEEPRVFDGDGRLAGQYAEELHVTFVKRAFLLAVHGHGADGVIVQNERNRADRTGVAGRLDAEALHFFLELIADQKRLRRLNNILGQVFARRARAFGKAFAIHDVQFEADLTGLFVVEGNEHASDVQQALHLRINALEEGVRLEGRAQRPADLIQNVQLFAAPRRLLNQIAVLNGHADLVAQSE